MLNVDKLPKEEKHKLKEMLEQNNRICITADNKVINCKLINPETDTYSLRCNKGLDCKLIYVLGLNDPLTCSISLLKWLFSEREE